MTKEKISQIRLVFKDMIKNKKIYNAKYLKELLDNYIRFKKQLDDLGEKVLTENDMKIITSLEDTESRIDMVIRNYPILKG